MLSIIRASARADVAAYFDEHSREQTYKRKDPLNLWKEEIDFVQKSWSEKWSLLDVGCGDGTFISIIAKVAPLAVYGIDISKGMMSQAHEHCSLLAADVLHPPFKENSFNVIHLDTVLHHIIGATPCQSMELARSALIGTVKLLEKEGYILIREIFCDSCLHSDFSIKALFWVLKLLSKLKSPQISIRHFHIPRGLQVRFFSSSDLEQLANLGKLVYFKQFPWNLMENMTLLEKILYKLAFVKSMGNVKYFVQKI